MIRQRKLGLWRGGLRPTSALQLVPHPDPAAALGLPWGVRALAHRLHQATLPIAPPDPSPHAWHRRGPGCAPVPGWWHGAQAPPTVASPGTGGIGRPQLAHAAVMATAGLARRPRACGHAGRSSL